MADVLKISTPLVERAPVNASRPAVDSSEPFNLVDASRVMQPHDASELLQQNTGFLPQDEAPKILADLLKDPAVTVGIMRSLYMLQEVVGLLAAGNTTLTEEIEQLFQQLMVAPEDIAGELQRQENSTTLFKGEIFDQLRNLLAAAAEAPVVQTTQNAQIAPVAQQTGQNLQTDIGMLLKSINASMSQTDALQSVANNLQYIADNVSEKSPLSGKLQTIIQGLRAPDAAENFSTLKKEVQGVLPEVESNLMFTPQMEKVLPLVTYNLSRFNDNESFVHDALRQLLTHLPEADRDEFAAKLAQFMMKFSGPDGAKAARAEEDDSKVMDVIAKIIGREADSEDLEMVTGDKMLKIVHSILSSPSNFTPLLHFIVPVDYQDVKAFAEIWIDPNAEEDTGGKRGGVADNSHMLMVFDVEDIGRFEAELYVQEKRIAMNLLCPPAYVEQFQSIGPAIRRAVERTGYSFEAINIDRLERTHSLMDVFTDLPSKRTGIDVKV